MRRSLHPLNSLLATRHSVRRTSRRSSLLALALATTVLPGCVGTLVGDWHLVRAEPSRQSFSLDRMSFKGDGTYTSSAVIDGRAREEQGAFEFSGFKLKLWPKEGGVRLFTAQLTFDRLELNDGTHKLFMRKGPRRG